MFRVDFTVRPRPGVRDPQGEAVEESLRSLGYHGLHVLSVGRCLRMDLEAANEEDARRMADDMCRRLLVNPNLEVCELTVARA